MMLTRRRYRRVPMRALLLVAALLLLSGCGAGDGGPATTAAPDPLVGALRAGGLTLVMRHAATDATVVNGRERIGSCARQRNLSGAGREQARAIGRAVRALRIPIGEVRASPLCRTRETAELAFGRVTLDRGLVTPGVLGTEADDRRRGRALRRRVERGPGTRTDAVLVTHTGTIGEAFGVVTVEEGEALVFAPGARLVGRIPAERWARLVGSAG